MQSLSALLDRVMPQVPREPLPPCGPILIYGAGRRGMELAIFLQAAGLALLGFADRNAGEQREISGLPLRTLGKWVEQIGADVGAVTVVVAIHNPDVPMAPLLDSLERVGFARIINPVELHACFPTQLPDAYWLTAPSRYGTWLDAIGSLDRIFDDALSLDTLARTIEFRLTGRYERLPDPSLKDQYQPLDLPCWRNPMRLIDCGAYIGDTVAAFRANGYAFDAIAAFEPDPENYAQLKRNIGKDALAICFPCGTSDKTGWKTFSASATAASHIEVDAAHGIQIQCVAIDDALHNFTPTLIKMDIEGEEPAALIGAARTIADGRPALAISAYHCPEHLWVIPRLIDSWQLGYRFLLRAHAHSSFDLVLYALPN